MALQDSRKGLNPTLQLRNSLGNGTWTFSGTGLPVSGQPAGRPETFNCPFDMTMTWGASTYSYTSHLCGQAYSYSDP